MGIISIVFSAISYEELVSLSKEYRELTGNPLPSFNYYDYETAEEYAEHFPNIWSEYQKLF